MDTQTGKDRKQKSRNNGIKDTRLTVRANSYMGEFLKIKQTKDK